MLALDDASVMVRAAADTQPVPADPFATAGDDRLAGSERRAALQASASVSAVNTLESCADSSGSLDLGRE